jgi:hypothetical protein
MAANPPQRLLGLLQRYSIADFDMLTDHTA